MKQASNLFHKNACFIVFLYICVVEKHAYSYRPPILGGMVRGIGESDETIVFSFLFLLLCVGKWEEKGRSHTPHPSHTSGDGDRPPCRRVPDSERSRVQPDGSVCESSGAAFL